MEEPIRTILVNAGYEPGAIMANIEQAVEGHGFDVRCEQVVNMAEAGIFDVAAAQRTAIHTAVTTAATALTVDSLIHKRKPEETHGRP